MSWCPRPFVLPCSSIRPMLRTPRPHCGSVQEAARVIGLQIHVLNASTSREIDAAFATLARERPDALFVAGDAFFNSRRVQFATLAARDRIPAAYADRDIVAAGGLMSYGTDIADMLSSSRRLYRQHPQGRQARRPAGRAVDQVRVRHQPANGEGARHRGAGNAPRDRRRGDPVSAAQALTLFALRAMGVVDARRAGWWSRRGEQTRASMRHQGRHRHGLQDARVVPPSTNSRSREWP